MAQIVPIGPIGVGKSSVAAVVSERKGRRNVPLDDVRWFYYYKLGYDRLEERRRVQEGGFLARFAYWKPYEAYAVERVLADFPDAIIDFGAGHSVHDDEGLFARVEAALAPVPHVILLLPSQDIEESLVILSERVPPEEREGLAEINHGLLANPSNLRLATHIVLTGRRPLLEVCGEVLELLAGDLRPTDDRIKGDEAKPPNTSRPRATGCSQGGRDGRVDRDPGREPRPTTVPRARAAAH